MTANVTSSLCIHHKYGFCKFGDNCKKHHVQNLCDVANCNGKACSNRHPKRCRYYTFYGSCKFGEMCSYLHEEMKISAIENLKKEIEDLQTKVERLEQLIGHINQNPFKCDSSSQKVSNDVFPVSSQVVIDIAQSSCSQHSYHLIKNFHQYRSAMEQAAFSSLHLTLVL